MTTIRRVGVSGAGGKLAYALLFRIASGELLGPHQKIALHLLETSHALSFLKGIVMELEDGCFPLLKEIYIGDDPQKLFKGVEIFFLIGSKPRGRGMERSDLLRENGAIFIEQGRALGKVAAPGAIVLVIGNPCNSNCLILQKHAQMRGHFFSMSLLDQYRAVGLVSRRAGLEFKDIKLATVWGNHSATQVPDFFNIRLCGKPPLEVISDRKWWEEEWVSQVQQRGAVVLQALGQSSVASAAHAALGAMRSLIEPTPKGESFSMGISSDGNSYGIEEGLVFSFPCFSHGWGRVEIVKGLSWNEPLRKRIEVTERELIEERSKVVDFL